MIKTQLSTNSSNNVIIESSSKNIHNLEFKISRNLSVHFLVAREIVRDKELSMANNRILTILSRNLKQTRTFYKPQRKTGKILINLSSCCNRNLVRDKHNIK